MQAEDLSEVQGLLHAGVITVPCLIAIKHCLATTNTPIESRMGKKQGIMVLTSKYIETFDPRPDRSAVQVLFTLSPACIQRTVSPSLAEQSGQAWSLMELHDIGYYCLLPWTTFLPTIGSMFG